jgi:hypothetical protein
LKYDDRLFIEKFDKRSENTDMVQKSRTKPARIADGTPGVFIQFGRTYAVATEAQALTFANMIVDALEAARKELT